MVDLDMESSSGNWVSLGPKIQCHLELQFVDYLSPSTNRHKTFSKPTPPTLTTCHMLEFLYPDSRLASPTLLTPFPSLPLLLFDFAPFLPFYQWTTPNGVRCFPGFSHYLHMLLVPHDVPLSQPSLLDSGYP